jgi:hypothetical protein
MDDSIATSAIFRSRAYQAMDKERLDVLGQVVKDKIRSGEEVDWLELQGEYASRGGRIESFGAAVQRWEKAANVAAANSLMQHNRTEAGKRMILVMGGEPLPDYRNIELE